MGACFDKEKVQKSVNEMGLNTYLLEYADVTDLGDEIFAKVARLREAHDAVLARFAREGINLEDAIE